MLKNLTVVILLVFCLSACVMADINIDPTNAGTHTVPANSTHFTPVTVLGVGFGIPYGGAGMNVEHHMTDQFSLSAGLGDYVYGLGWSLGARFYTSPDTGHKARFRLSAGVGTVACKTEYTDYYSYYGYLYSTSSNTTVTGGYLGIGWAPNCSNGYRGWDFDLYGTTVGASISAGYHF